jgi:cellulose synthase/poly-beta-1,6-N-acetylglucosamine synthase-like glycosyltransferase
VKSALDVAQPGAVPTRARSLPLKDPQLLVVDKENGGKADALNAGLNYATGELVGAIDADTPIGPDALLRIVRPFLTDENVVAAVGTIRVANGSKVAHGRVLDVRVPRGLLAGCQTVEYLRSFLFGRLGWNKLGGNLIISGAFGLFRREAVLEVGGYVHDTVGEGMELTACGARAKTAGPRASCLPGTSGISCQLRSLITKGLHTEASDRVLPHR